VYECTRLSVKKIIRRYVTENKILTLICPEDTFFWRFHTKNEHDHFYSLPLNTTSNLSSKTTIPTLPKSNTPELGVRAGELWKAIVIQYKRNSEITSKSSDFSTASSYASISDDSDASSLVSLVCSEVEGLTEDLASPPIPREVVFHPENSSLFHPNYQAEAEFSWMCV